MKNSGFDNINVIPLVDVMLVLLTIVLTTSTFIASGAIPVELPKAASAEKQEKSLIIEIDADGRVHLSSKPLSMQQLKTSMSRMQRERPILIRADRSLELQPFVDVLETVKGLGFTKVSLQTEQRP